MHRARVDLELGLIARRDPAHVHEQGVVEEWISRSDREQGWRHVARTDPEDGVVLPVARLLDRQDVATSPHLPRRGDRLLGLRFAEKRDSVALLAAASMVAGRDELKDAMALLAAILTSGDEKLAAIPFNKDDFKNDPLIQKALEIFKGQIVEVRA